MRMKLVLALTSLSLLSGCYSFKESLGRYNLPIKHIKNPTKEGKSCNSFVFPLYFVYSDSDLTIDNARQEGGITSITAIEKETYSVFPFYTKTCVIVKGN